MAGLICSISALPPHRCYTESIEPVMKFNSSSLHRLVASIFIGFKRLAELFCKQPS
uniref:Uncharacterized protein n=1 Tax=Parascaris equorum TaxID=6256 RepID=A0A914RPY4_PAREQ